MISLKQVFEEVCEQECAEFDNAPRHRFSRRSRKRLEAMLYGSPAVQTDKRTLPVSKRIAIALVIVLLLLFGVTAVAGVKGFGKKEHRGNTELFLTDCDNSPQTIEYVYYLSDIPEGYELKQSEINSVDVTYFYKNDKGESLVFVQRVKTGYVTHLDNEHSTLENVEVNGHKGGICLIGIGGSLIWDNGDYVLEISGNFDKNKLLSLAKSAKF